MKICSTFLLDFGELNDIYYKLLSNEDFEFKTKNIKLNILKLNSGKIKVKFISDSVIDLKIASNSLIKSLEIIDKTYNI